MCDRFAGPVELVVSLALVAVATIVWRLPARSRGIALGLAVLLSVPGYYALAARRADSPLRAGATAARLGEVERRLEEDARARGCENETSPCEPCQPIARFAHSKRGVCEAVKPRPRITIAAVDAGGPACGDDGLECASP